MNRESLIKIIAEFKKSFSFLTDEDYKYVIKKYINKDVSEQVVRDELMYRVRAFALAPKLIRINDFFSYSIGEDYIHIHFNILLIDKMEKTLDNKVFKEYLQTKLKETLILCTSILYKNPKIDKVMIISKYVGKYKKVFENVGFSIFSFTKNELDEVFYKKSEKDKISLKEYALISASMLLNLYLGTN
jgi:hypothetical protein